MSEGHEYPGVGTHWKAHVYLDVDFGHAHNMNDKHGIFNGLKWARCGHCQAKMHAHT